MTGKRRKQAKQTPDQLIRNWTKEVEQLWQETSYLFWSRKLYRAVGHMFQTNHALQKCGADVWQWIRLLYGREAVMGIRREMDHQPNAVSLLNLLHEVESNAHVLTRERHRANFGGLQTVMGRKVNDLFEKAGGPPGPGLPSDHIRAEAIAEDCKALEKATAGAVKYANLVLAHRQPVPPTLPFKEVDEALGALFVCFRKYYSLITGSGLMSPTPVPQFDWLRPFRMAWITTDFDLPKDRWEL